MTRFFAEPLGYLLNALYGWIGNYGITLVIFTLLFRLCIYPLYAYQIKSSAQMQFIQPKIQSIQKKYANDREEMNRQVMELYKEHRINPAMGCLPLLIQMPILFGLFALLRTPTQFITNPDIIMAVHESFFWIKDLSQPDLWILPIGAGLATYFQQKITMATTSFGPSNSSTNATMKSMLYLMPVLIVWWGRGFPAGLCLYWFVGTAFQAVMSLLTVKWRRSLTEKHQAVEEEEE